MVYDIVHWIHNQWEASRLVQEREELARQQATLQERQDDVSSNDGTDAGGAGGC